MESLSSYNVVEILWSCSLSSNQGFFSFCIQSDRIGADEEIDDTKGMTEQEIKEMVEEREAKANAQLLEMVRSCFLVLFVILYRSCLW